MSNLYGHELHCLDCGLVGVANERETVWDTQRYTYQKFRPSGQAMTRVLAQYGQKSMVGKCESNEWIAFECSPSLEIQKQTNRRAIELCPQKQARLSSWRRGMALAVTI
jgi:hypothetical protein